MAEKSIFWTTGATGDGASEYTQAEVIRWMRQMMLNDNSEEGVHLNYGNELEVTGTSSPVAVDTGAAIVYGFPYWNTASVDVAIPTPSASTRVDLIVLEADWTAQTVRVTRVAGTEGAGAPSLTQTDGVEWQIPLAQASITTGGVITVTDARVFLHPNIEVETAMIEDLAVTTAKLAADAVTGAKIGDDEIDSEHYAAGSIDEEHIANNAVALTKIPNRTESLFVPAVYADDGSGSQRNWTAIYGWQLPDGVSSYVRAFVEIPERFVSGAEVSMKFNQAAAGNFYGSLTASYGGAGEAQDANEDTTGDQVFSGTANVISETSGLALSSAAAGDLVAITFRRQGANENDTVGDEVDVMGFILEFTADS